jgi:hypothetical protein
MLRKILCFLGFHKWEQKEVITFFSTDKMDICKYCATYKNPIILKKY